MEQNELKAAQTARQRREREEEKADAARIVASQVNNVIEIIDNELQEVGDNVRDSIEAVIHELGPNVVHNTNVRGISVPKKHYKRRPENWIELAKHWYCYKKVKLTIDKFKLRNLNPNYDYWQNVFSRWYKQFNAGKKKLKLRRSPSIGDEVDEELVKVVVHYNTHGVPVTNLILKLAALDILKKKNRQDILNKIVDDDADAGNAEIKLGKSWFQRFYRLVNILLVNM